MTAKTRYKAVNGSFGTYITRDKADDYIANGYTVYKITQEEVTNSESADSTESEE